MSSTYTVSPKSLHDLREHPQGRGPEPHLADARNNYNQNHPITPVDSNLLSPYSSQVQSNTASPDTNPYTPSDSIGSFYQQSDFDDPFFGANFDDVEAGSPDFLDHPPSLSIDVPHQSTSSPSLAQNDVGVPAGYPISPRKSPHNTIPSFDVNANHTANTQASAASQGFSNPPRPSVDSVDSEQSSPQLTPDTNGGGWSRSSTDSVPPAIRAMANQSPRVTVSLYGRDGERPVQGVERHLPTTAESPKTVRGTHSLAGDLAVESGYDISANASRDTQGLWVPDPATGHSGLAPEDRPSAEVPSPNEQAAQQQVMEKNKEIDDWVKSNTSNNDPNSLPSFGNNQAYNPSTTPYADEDGIPRGDIPLGDTTENRHIPGQTYYRTDGPGGPITQTDFSIMRQLRIWADAPMVHEIQTEHSQPGTANAAMERFMRQCQDNASIVSRAATWGTRRRSLPSVMDEEGVLSGNFLKKLSISGHSRRPSILSKIDSLIRKPSLSDGRKRKGSNASEIQPEDLEDEGTRRESKDSLAPPSRTSSWGLGGGNKKPTPSLNTALVGMATGAAAIGATHARTGSISATPITSPKSPFGSFSNALNVPPVKNPLRRPRSRTELPKHTTPEGLSHPHLIGMLKKQGGPPVAQLARSQPTADQDEDEDEDDENFDNADAKPDTSKMEAIEPTLEGFKQHVLRLNPQCNDYLVDRMAHQLNARYKQLCITKVTHLKQVSQRKCPSGAMCIASGGSAILLDNRRDSRGVDPLAAVGDSSDGDTPLDSGITADSFPQGIPTPPTVSLPAEFECQLCFCNKKFLKPSDWTKHVHEDVQPFTCTWPNCNSKEAAKMFKRKADWVRHENEGHRHLEWWTCNVDECRHICYRRDNFLQHLVREHKFIEPKIKTKAAIKRAGGGDHTWQQVEQCHVETSQRPQEEPCRFCGKVFPTWKKLTVHLAKHMEHISLPILKLVAAKELDVDTVISPVQERPPTTFGAAPVPIIKQEPPPSFSNPVSVHSSAHPSPMNYNDHTQFAGNYQSMSQAQPPLQPPYFPQQPQQFTDMPPHPGTGLVMPQVTTGMHPQPHYHSMPVTTSSYGQPVGAYMNLPDQGCLGQGSFSAQGLEPFPAFDSLGIHDQAGAITYDDFTDASMQQQQAAEQYSNHGSVSPYAHSPHQGHGNFYNP